MITFAVATTPRNSNDAPRVTVHTYADIAWNHFFQMASMGVPTTISSVMGNDFSHYDVSYTPKDNRLTWKRF